MKHNHRTQNKNIYIVPVFNKTSVRQLVRTCDSCRNKFIDFSMRDIEIIHLMSFDIIMII